MGAFLYNFLLVCLCSSAGQLVAAANNNNNNAAQENDDVFLTAAPTVFGDDFYSSTVAPTVYLEPITNDNIHLAVQKWIHRPADAEAEYGHISQWDVSSVQDMSNLFSTKRLNPAATFNDDITSWNTAKLEDMSYIFYGNKVMNLDLSHWTVRHVKYAQGAFQNTKEYTGLGLAYWTVSKLQNASSMFANAEAFDANGIHKWTLDSLIDASEMFYGASSFQGDHYFQWNTTSLENAEGMFAYCSSFIGDLTDLDTSSVTTMKGMFYNASSFNGDVGYWNTSNVKDMNSVFAYATAFEGDGLEAWDVSKTTTMENMFMETSVNEDVSLWDVSNCQDLRNVFRYATRMKQSLCWNLRKDADVDGIFFQSQAHFDPECVKDKNFIRASCCDPSIDKTCGCAGVSGFGGGNAADSPKSHYLAAVGIIAIAASMFLIVVAFRRWKKRGISTSLIGGYGLDDPDASISDMDMDIKMNVTKSTSCSPVQSFSEDGAYSDTPNPDYDGDGPLEDIQVREII